MAEIQINRKSDNFVYILIVDKESKKTTEVKMTLGQFGQVITNMPNCDCEVNYRALL